jgi:nucleoside-diphosphate-sugar epimerase
VANIGKQRCEQYKGQDCGAGPKLGYIYISGAWVHGETATEASDIDEVGLSTSEAPALDIVGWRPDLERQILKSREWLDVLILRPATMYGRTSAIWSALFGPIASAVKEGKHSVQIPVVPSSRSSLVHVDDVAEAVSLGVARLQLLSGTSVYPVFNLSSSTEDIGDVLRSFAVEMSANSGSKTPVQLELLGPGDDVFLAALGSSVQVSSARAGQLLHWTPRRIGFVRDMRIFAMAWESSQ